MVTIKYLVIKLNWHSVPYHFWTTLNLLLWCSGYFWLLWWMSPPCSGRIHGTMDLLHRKDRKNKTKAWINWLDMVHIRLVFGICWEQYTAWECCQRTQRHQSIRSVKSPVKVKIYSNVACGCCLHIFSANLLYIRKRWLCCTLIPLLHLVVLAPWLKG